jgi:hypothetical protein
LPLRHTTNPSWESLDGRYAPRGTNTENHHRPSPVALWPSCEPQPRAIRPLGRRPPPSSREPPPLGPLAPVHCSSIPCSVPRFCCSPALRPHRPGAAPRRRVDHALPPWTPGAASAIATPAVRERRRQGAPSPHHAVTAGRSRGRLHHRRVRLSLRLAMGHVVPVCATRRAEDCDIVDTRCRDDASEPCAATEPQATVATLPLHRVLGLRAAVPQVLRRRPALP